MGILSVQGQNQLPRLGDAYPEQHLIAADRAEEEGQRTESANIRVGNRAILRKADVCPRSKRQTARTVLVSL